MNTDAQPSMTTGQRDSTLPSAVADRGIDRFHDIDTHSLTPLEEASLYALVRECIARRFKRGVKFDGPETAIRQLQLLLASENNVVFGALWLDAGHRLIAQQTLSTGSIRDARYQPRTAVREALMHNAAAALLYSNFPSGNVCASSTDREFIPRIKKTLAEFDVTVVDYIVIGGNDAYSFAEKGHL